MLSRLSLQDAPQPRFMPTSGWNAPA